MDVTLCLCYSLMSILPVCHSEKEYRAALEMQQQLEATPSSRRLPYTGHRPDTERSYEGPSHFDGAPLSVHGGQPSSVHSGHPSSHSSGSGSMAPVVAPRSAPPVQGRAYNAHSYQDSLCKVGQEAPLSYQGGGGDAEIKRCMNSEFAQARTSRHPHDMSPTSTSSVSTQPSGPLDFTIDQNSQNSSTDKPGAVFHDGDLDVSLEHETRSTPVSANNSLTYASGRKLAQAITRSVTDLAADGQRGDTRTSQGNRGRSSPGTPGNRVHSRSMENLSPKKQTKPRWGAVEIDIDAAYPSNTRAQARKDGAKPASPLTSTRLRPIRQKTSNAVVNILDDGVVCLEFFKTRGGEERVKEVWWISPDGVNVEVYQPNGDKGVPLRKLPPSPPSPSSTHLKHFKCSDLPTKYWKKYQYATR